MHNIEIIDSTDSSVHLTISKPCIKDSSNEIKGFKYKIMLKVLLSKYKENTDR